MRSLKSLLKTTAKDDDITSLAFAEVFKMFDSNNGFQVFRKLISDFAGGEENGRNALKIASEILAGRTVAECLEITEEEIEALHILARIQASEGRHSASVEIYALLTMLNQNEVKFQKGLGLNAKAIGEYEKAIEALAVVLLMNPDDIESGLAIAECHLASGKKAKAQEILEKIVMNSNGNKENSRFITRSTAIIDAIKSTNYQNTFAFDHVSRGNGS